jgi:hypothetical protein
MTTLITFFNIMGIVYFEFGQRYSTTGVSKMFPMVAALLD